MCEVFNDFNFNRRAFWNLSYFCDFAIFLYSFPGYIISFYHFPLNAVSLNSFHSFRKKLISYKPCISSTFFLHILSAVSRILSSFDFCSFTEASSLVKMTELMTDPLAVTHLIKIFENRFK